jgi:four helix bundle protein
MSSNLPYVKSYRDLLVYQKARVLSHELFRVTVNFPREEKFSLIDQVRRSLRSIGAQIAEAWAKRRYERHFCSKLTDADGEQQETQHWIDTAVDCGYLDQGQAHALLQKCEEIGRLLGGMIAKSEQFCGEPNRTLREMPTEYFIPPTPYPQTTPNN